MIVDTHTHLPPDSFFPAGLGQGPDGFLALCDAHGIDVAWVFTTAGLSDPDPRHNDVVREFCAAAPDRLVPFCTVFPHLPGAVDELHRAVEEGGARGLKLHPWLQGFSPLDPRMDDLGTALEALGIPVVFHDGTPPNSSPLQVAAFAERHPGVPVILGHGGLHDLWVEALAALQRVDNLWVSPSGMPPSGLRRMVDQAGASRLLFGSDAGFGDPHWQAFQLRKIRDLRLPPEAELAVLGGNARLLVQHRPEHQSEPVGGPPPARAGSFREAGQRDRGKT
ncbi:amidohydrolase family protein [Kribbella alba]|uniref:Amidohydrolase family protein n=1 Tax=Kribbella alba TaxID=190197 RepID=A0ABN2FM49_9ACTN